MNDDDYHFEHDVRFEWSLGIFDEFDPGASCLEVVGALSDFHAISSNFASNAQLNNEVATTSHEVSSDDSNNSPRRDTNLPSEPRSLRNQRRTVQCQIGYQESSSPRNSGEQAHLTDVASQEPRELNHSHLTRCRVRRITNSQSRNSSAEYVDSNRRESVTGRRKATEEARSILMDWINDNRDHPYPSRAQKGELAARTGLTVAQIVHWMSNVRKRRLIPLLRGNRAPASKVDRAFLAEMARRAAR